MRLGEAIEKRHSSSKFKEKTPDWRRIIECIDKTRYAPMSGDLFTPRFILVQDTKKIQEIASATQQHFVSEAKYIVVMCSENSKAKAHFGENSNKYIATQNGAAIQNFLLSLEEKGLVTTWIKLFIEENIKEILSIPEELEVVAIFPIGYEFKKPTTQKQLIELERILYYDKYKNKRMSEPNVAGIDSTRPWM
jgi:nitroreductase